MFTLVELLCTLVELLGTRLFLHWWNWWNCLVHVSFYIGGIGGTLRTLFTLVELLGTRVFLHWWNCVRVYIGGIAWYMSVGNCLFKSEKHYLAKQEQKNIVNIDTSYGIPFV
jgi:hypothetical protein